MAIYHCSIKAVSRSSGRSAPAAAAYRAGVCLADARTGEIHDYRLKKGVVYAEMLFPDGIEMDREELWNQAEAAEKRKNSTVAREYEVALPAELSAMEQRDLALTFARKLIVRYGVAADVCIHAPGRGDDSRNFHAHILTTTRRVTPDGFAEKTRALDDRKTGEVEKIRAEWAELANHALKKAGFSERIDHRSLADQGEERPPTIHLGPAATAMERRGIQTERGDFNRHQGERGEDVRELAALEAVEAGISKARAKARAWRLAKEKAAAAEEAEKRFQRALELLQEKRQQEALAAASEEFSPEVPPEQQHPPMPSSEAEPQNQETEVFLAELEQPEEDARDAVEESPSSLMSFGP